MYRHHHPGPEGRGFPPLFDMAARLGDFPGPIGVRARRGDVRTAILRLLAEQPMHGYQIIRELADRSGGAWNPSAGSVYPTLQLLADEGLVDAEPSAGKKVYHLTDAGQAAAAGLEGQRAPWEEAAATTTEGAGYRMAAGRLAQAVFQIGSTGSEAQRTAAYEVMETARKQLYAILARE